MARTSSRPKRQVKADAVLAVHSPIILILLFASTLVLRQRSTDSVIIMVIVLSAASWAGRNTSVERSEDLMALVRLKAMVLRDGKRSRYLEDVVPGDIVILNAGDGGAGDCGIIESKNLYVERLRSPANRTRLKRCRPTCRPIRRSQSAPTRCSWAPTS
jgi:magnesium-transporting ATPase (P-type)